MKNLIIPLIAVLLFSCPNLPVSGQQYNEKIQKKFTLQKDAAMSTLFIYNIFGSLKIEGYYGNTVIIEVNESLTADDNSALETGKKEFKLGFEQKPDSIIAYIAAPFDSRPNHCNNINDMDYQIKTDYIVKVPYNMNLHVATVNDGAITISDVKGVLHVNNVNEGITIINAGGTTRAHTVNGDINITYLKNPVEPCSYQTINGDIKISYQQDLAADFQFKSMHGEFYTDFQEVETLPVSAAQKQEKNVNQMVYKLNKCNTIRFGKGGKVFKFETLNGDVYIKKQS